MDEIVLALGGGGIKGIAHVGVIRVLEEEGFKIRAIAGTSAGGLVGSLVASGLNSYDIEKLLHEYNTPRIFGRNHNDGPSLLGLAGIAELLAKTMPDMNFEDCVVPFACTAVDLEKSQEVILAKGPLIDAILATMAVPGVFPPRQIGQFTLVDGAVMDPVPVTLARWLAPASPVVAVCLSPSPDKWAHLSAQLHVPVSTPLPKQIIEQFSRMRFGQALQIFAHSIETTSRVLSELRLQQDRPDVLIRPAVENFGMLDQVDPHELILIGELACRQSLSEIRQALSWSNQISRYFKKPQPPEAIMPDTLQSA